MIQSLKQIKSKIRSIENTRKVTRAMQMISVAKLNRINKTLYALRTYSSRLEDMLRHLVESQEHIRNRYFEERQKIEHVVLCVITSDNGLCGQYNRSVLRAADEFIRKTGEERVALILVGKKGHTYFKKRGVKILHTYLGLNGRYDTATCDTITNVLAHLFVSGQADEVYVAYTYFKTGVLQNAVVDKFLNIEAGAGTGTEYITEQPIEKIVAQMTLAYLVTKTRLIFLQAFTSEHAARSLAMKSATDNAEGLLDGLVVMRNKVRQANITREMLELISSAEVLRG